jgi:hypothetical protein
LIGDGGDGRIGCEKLGESFFRAGNVLGVCDQNLGGSVADEGKSDFAADASKAARDDCRLTHQGWWNCGNSHCPEQDFLSTESLCD